jgi:hypothetical protein
MKNLIYGFVVFFVAFFTFGLLLRQYADVKLYSGKTCKHLDTYKAQFRYRVDGRCFWVGEKGWKMDEIHRGCDNLKIGDWVEYQWTDNTCH